MTRRKSYQKGNVQLHNGQWTLRYREFNHASGGWILKREVLGEFKNKKTALKAAEPIMVRVNERNNSTRSQRACAEITFREFIAGRWKAYTVSAKHQPSTADTHNSIIAKHLLPFFGERKMADITPGEISDFLESMQKPFSGNTVLNVYRMLCLMFNIAREYDLIEHSPVRSKIHKPQFDKQEKPTLAPEQIRAVLSSLSVKERLYALVIASTGMRMNEGLALRWMDFDETRREVSITHTLYRSTLKAPKTPGSVRKLRLHQTLSGLLAWYRSQSSWNADGDLIFCREDGNPLNCTSLRSHLYVAMDRAGIKRNPGQYGFHIFRHTAGSLIYAKSRDLKLVQGALGHADISTTSDIYAHLDSEIVAEGTEILAEEILGNCDLFVTQTSEMVS